MTALEVGGSEGRGGGWVGGGGGGGTSVFTKNKFLFYSVLGVGWGGHLFSLKTNFYFILFYTSKS